MRTSTGPRHSALVFGFDGAGGRFSMPCSGAVVRWCAVARWSSLLVERPVQGERDAVSGAFGHIQKSGTKTPTRSEWRWATVSGYEMGEKLLAKKKIGTSANILRGLVYLGANTQEPRI